MQIALESVVTGSRRLPSVLPARRTGGVGLHRYELEMYRNESLRSGASVVLPDKEFRSLVFQGISSLKWTLSLSSSLGQNFQNRGCFWFISTIHRACCLKD